MTFKRPSRRHLQASCDTPGPEDGLDPRTFFRDGGRRRVNRKALQLCGQIAQTLSVVLAYETADDLLRCLVVESVEPAPDSGRVLVTVSLPPGAPDAPPADVYERLGRVAGWLRTQVAAAIHRKRVPQIAFRVVGRREGEQ